MDNIRVFDMDQPEDNELIDVNIIRQFLGNDYARQLVGNDINQLPKPQE